MFNIGGGEMVVLAILALLVFGPEGLPDILRTVARTVKAFKTAASDFQSEVNTALTVEQQKREVEQRRRKRSLPAATEGGAAAAATAVVVSVSDQETEAASQVALDSQQESTPTEIVAISEPETEPAASEAGPSAVVLEAAEALSVAPHSLTGDADVEQSVDADGHDDDGPGRPMTRPARPAAEVPEDDASPPSATRDEKPDAKTAPEAV